MERQEPKTEKQEPRATRHFQFRSPQSCVSLSPFISRADWCWEILFFYLICREYSHTFSYYNPDWFRRAPYKCVGLCGLLTSFSVRSLFSFYIYYCPALLAECSGGGSREPEIQKVPSWMNQDLGSLITILLIRVTAAACQQPPSSRQFYSLHLQTWENFFHVYYALMQIATKLYNNDESKRGDVISSRKEFGARRCWRQFADNSLLTAPSALECRLIRRFIFELKEQSIAPYRDVCV